VSAVLLFSALLSMLLWHSLPQCIGMINIWLYGTAEFPFPVLIHHLLQFFFSLYVFGSLFPFLFFTGLSVLPETRTQANTSLPFVSVVIPSFNEEANMAQCLESVMRLDYPAYEVIIVDDGSRDLTLPIIEQYDVSLIRLRNNRGKVAALNKGIEKAKGEIIFFTDSDSSLDPMVLHHLVSNFGDASVGAVAGRVLLKRNDSYLKRMQTIEYLYGQAIIKEAQIRSGESVSICPGPVTAFRRSALLEIGGFNQRTLAEDFDVTLDLLELGYSALYEPRAVSFTSAMTSWKGLKKQRIRWSRGHLQVFRQHRAVFFTDAIGTISRFWLPYSLFTGFGSAFLEMVFLVLFPLVVAFSTMPLEFLKFGLTYMLAMECITALQGIIPLLQSGQVSLSLVLSSFLTQPYRVFLSYTRLVAYVQEMQDKNNVW
jgi:cellulose synthase/poly-beta-1,6-N-acetylglucosamine synthase-like glycosyltransferase